MSIKNFSVLSKLGEGSYSSVYKVKRLDDEKEYALKKVKLGKLSDKQLQNAINQVRILASIKQMNIISYKQAFLDGKNLCMIMQFANGGDLYDKIIQNRKKKHYFDQNQIWSILIQITRGLKILHNMNIFHRDIKSANIFLNAKGQAKLGDFNVSKIAQNGLLFTQTGTPYYASPEVWNDQPYDEKSDIWSFGCVIYEMTTLFPPFKGQDMQSLFQKVTIGNYDPIPSFYSKQLSSIIRLLLQKNPSNRPNTEKLLKSSLLNKKTRQLKIFNFFDDKKNIQLLSPIKIPKKLNNLTERLPKSNYETSPNSYCNTLKNLDFLKKKSDNSNNSNYQNKARVDSLPKIWKNQRKGKNRSLDLESTNQQEKNVLAMNIRRQKQEMRQYLAQVKVNKENQLGDIYEKYRKIKKPTIYQRK